MEARNCARKHFPSYTDEKTGDSFRLKKRTLFKYVCFTNLLKRPMSELLLEAGHRQDRCHCAVWAFS